MIIITTNKINNSITSLASMDKYSEIEILKDKLIQVSIEDADNKINGENNESNESG